MLTMTEGLFEDAKLSTEKWTIPINKNLLMAKSKFFAALLSK